MVSRHSSNYSRQRALLSDQMCSFADQVSPKDDEDEERFETFNIFKQFQFQHYDYSPYLLVLTYLLTNGTG